MYLSISVKSFKIYIKYKEIFESVEKQAQQMS